ncbi:N-6 DNA methylase [Candidatus Bathyarchaeota archaeon]|nr:N-6 DNA methylase [Candidatus Bathyarchaeota archaeon]
MTKYDNLDSRTQLEQTITEDLQRALGKRGFIVKHQGTAVMNAAGDRPDIIVDSDTARINVEVTQTTKASSGREFLPIKDHLEKAKKDKDNAIKKCFVIYVSPETHYRMINAIRDYNILNKDSPDMKMLPLCFSTFELFVNKLITSTAELYTIKDIISLFDDYKLFVDDERILEVLHDRLFSSDDVLRKQVELEEENRHQRTVEELIQNLLQLEDKLREEKGITHIDAIRDIIFLVFIKLYEEKREFEDKENRFKVDTFKKYQATIDQEKEKHAIRSLFDLIEKDPTLVAASVFTETDNLSEKLDDDFVLKFFVEPFEKYHFYTTRIDGIGAAYEVLGMRAGKDVKAGQFFTPENVVKFMMKLAELDVDDVVLDPACGTSRFLVYAMEDMLKKAEKTRNSEEKKEKIRKEQLFGTDYDLRVAKLAKMNMYIHGDGKANIFSQDGLLLYDEKNRAIPTNMDDRIDVILTNPPLGGQSYQRSEYNEKFKTERMEVIPKRNLTKEELEAKEKRLQELQPALTSAQTSQDLSKAKKLTKSLKQCSSKIASLRADLDAGRIKWSATGNQMKGGALFVGAAKHYLKAIRNKNELVEWRGGKLLIILDEGILNTKDYQSVRDIIRKYFFVKAIISLSRDTFVPVSSTATKTSILYAIKKDDPDITQKEPIFFAHAEKVGIDTKKRVCPNHLFDSGNDILSKYFEFKQKVLKSYAGLEFKKERFEQLGFKMGTIEDSENNRKI